MCVQPCVSRLNPSGSKWLFYERAGVVFLCVCMLRVEMFSRNARCNHSTNVHHQATGPSKAADKHVCVVCCNQRTLGSYDAPVWYFQTTHRYIVPSDQVLFDVAPGSNRHTTCKNQETTGDFVARKPFVFCMCFNAHRIYIQACIYIYIYKRLQMQHRLIVYNVDCK